MSASDHPAGEIARDILQGRTFNPYPDTRPRSLAEGYALQDAVVARLQRDGARGAVGGWKIAANSAALMQRFSMSEPASGRVFADQRHASPARLKAAEFAQFAYEPEIAAVIGQRLAPPDAPFERAEIIDAVTRFVPALELLDMRRVDVLTSHMPDIIGQNITNAGAVIGGPGIAPDALDVARQRMIVTIDGQDELDVTGAAPQDPCAAVLWLANHLAARGLTLEAGQVVLCGTHAPIRLLPGPARIAVDMPGMGSVRLDLV
ncbi:2-keto-4-pentenoate hydratase [Sulfitobacter aestuarii]|uniref:2-keto-4-pentenoate hydratase n=1 Tax=Sulfitobacter aestuarii TaxID=2161676 RepID=A0ABW5U0Y2_9RHOB